MTTFPVPPMTPYGARHRPPEGLGIVTAAARDTIRRYGTLTGALRLLPDYLIIGTKRGGTTSLARWLLDHPDVRGMFPDRETRKGAYYFDVNYDRGEAWYRSHFPTAAAHDIATRRHGRRRLLGDATPYYLHHPHAPMRARQAVPGVKVIALLRNPVDRAQGHWAERRRQGVEPLDFAAAVDAEHERLAGEEERMLADPGYTSFAHQHYSYVDQGRYARGLDRWMQTFPAGQLLVLRSEDLYAEPVATLRTVQGFLGLTPHTPDRLRAWNRSDNDALDPAMRDRLCELLAPDIADVERLLGRSMDWA